MVPRPAALASEEGPGERETAQLVKPLQHKYEDLEFDFPAPTLKTPWSLLPSTLAKGKAPGSLLTLKGQQDVSADKSACHT